MSDLGWFVIITLIAISLCTLFVVFLMFRQDALSQQRAAGAVEMVRTMLADDHKHYDPYLIQIKAAVDNLAGKVDRLSSRIESDGVPK